MGNLATDRLAELERWLSDGMRRSLDGLTTRERECVLLSYVEEWTQEEIATELAIRQQVVQEHLANGIRKLRSSHTHMEMFQ